MSLFSLQKHHRIFHSKFSGFNEKNFNEKNKAVGMYPCFRYTEQEKCSVLEIWDVKTDASSAPGGFARKKTQKGSWRSGLSVYNTWTEEAKD